MYYLHFCYYHECRAWLQNRFCLMLDFHDFSCLETAKPRKMNGSEAISLCWRTMWFWSDSQSSPASLKKPISENNNGVRGEELAIESKHIWVDHVLILHALRILLSEFDESQKQISLGIKVSCCVDGMSHVNQMKNSRHGLSSFLMYFHMVSRRFPEVEAIYGI